MAQMTNDVNSIRFALAQAKTEAAWAATEQPADVWAAAVTRVKEIEMQLKRAEAAVRMAHTKAAMAAQEMVRWGTLCPNAAN